MRPSDGAEAGMKTMYLAFLAIAVIAAGAGVGLSHAGFSTRDVTHGPSVRLD